ncbi:uncharacterized protein C8A04DRAFT_37366 [Dichotomopilus funicola]|uniref:BZIP domain-containing protein n=1 Tax=Dichotomopilus funicola TaxID=1934379 RepID=A0AAN6ZNH7_9PEZI|nr:hypothetical protein C8A04DRAFT_37366 [Dichotomopilus funicola]
MSEMNAWAGAASPNIKFEGSPTESLLSTPDEMYPSLFGTSPVSTTTINPSEMMTPQSVSEDGQSDLTMLSGLSALSQSTLAQTPAPSEGTPEPEKKPVKKRKSWGQVLPEPKTNLPPRKRAKTEDEKEQRRVERVLRNRRAAQSSRERKRLEVEGLEKRNKELEMALVQAQQMNMTLLEEIQKIRGPGASRTTPSFDALRQPPVTFSHQLFSSQDENAAGSLEQLLQSLPSANNKTVNPASLSPTLTPIDEMADEEDEEETATSPVADTPALTEGNASTDATQHPAEMLCSDLPCRLVEASPSSWQMVSQQRLQPTQWLLLQLQFLLASTSAMLSVCQRPLTQIAISLRAGSSLRPTPAITNTIIWLVTTPHPSSSQTTSTSTSSSPIATSTSRPATSSSSSTSTAAPSQTRRSSLRLRTLRKILTCSPILARPLKDATMAVLRLVSSEGSSVDRVSGADEAATVAANGGSSQQLPRRGSIVGWPSGAMLPSKEVLLSLLWVLRVEERRIRIREQAKASLKLGTSGVPRTSNMTKTYVMKVSSRNKHTRQGENRAVSSKRRRFL